MLLASSFMVCLSHQTLSSMTMGGWLPSYYHLFVTEPNTCSRVMLRKCIYLGACCPKVDIPGVDALCQLKEMFQFFKGGTSLHQGAWAKSRALTCCWYWVRLLGNPHLTSAWLEFWSLKLEGAGKNTSYRQHSFVCMGWWLFFFFPFLVLSPLHHHQKPSIIKGERSK